MSLSSDVVKDRTAAERVFRQAAEDSPARRRLAQDPAGVLREAGMEIPRGHDEGFDAFVRRIAPQYTHPALTAEAQADALTASFGCIACQVGCYSIAATITAIGAAGLVLLSPEAAVVVALAAFAGVSTAAALAFMVGLATLAVFTVDAVVMHICAWTGACS